jgi:hypothetical protein
MSVIVGRQEHVRRNDFLDDPSGSSSPSASPSSADLKAQHSAQRALLRQLFPEIGDALFRRMRALSAKEREIFFLQFVTHLFHPYPSAYQ